MRNARLALRLVALALVTGLSWLSLVAGFAPARLLGRSVAWRQLVFQSWARAVARIIGMRVRVEGEPPSGAFLLVANHLAYVDVVLLASLARCAFVSKAEIARWPVIGVLARTAGTLFVERERKRDLPRIAAQMRTQLAAREGLVLFPEGTSSAGEGVLRFHSSLLAPAAELGLPVRHAAIRYATRAGEPPARLVVCWWGDMTFARHLLDLLRLDGFDAHVVFGEERSIERDRKLLARQLQRAVTRAFGSIPLPQHV